MCAQAQPAQVKRHKARLLRCQGWPWSSKREKELQQCSWGPQQAGTAPSTAAWLQGTPNRLYCFLLPQLPNANGGDNTNTDAKLRRPRPAHGTCPADAALRQRGRARETSGPLPALPWGEAMHMALRCTHAGPAGEGAMHASLSPSHAAFSGGSLAYTSYPGVLGCPCQA